MCTTLTRNGCVFTVTLNIEFRNSSGMAAAAFGALVAGWAAAIAALWSGPAGLQRYRCCRVRFVVNARVGFGTPNFHQVDVVAGPQTSFVNRLGPGCSGGRWDTLDVGNVAAHESGHLLGLPDEYDYGGPGGAYRNLNPQPAGQPQSIMAQTWGNVAALQTHIDAIMGLLGARCPWWCCIWRFLSVLFARREPVPALQTRIAIMHNDSSEDLRGRLPDDILAHMERGNPDAVSAGLELLRAQAPQHVGALVEALRHDHPIRRWAATVALADSAAPEARERLLSALTDTDVRVRVAAAGSLHRLGGREGVTVLVDALASQEVMLGHPPELVSDYALAVLRSMAAGKAP